MAIERLVKPQEREALAALGAHIEAIERRGATTGAAALWMVGVALRLGQAGARLQQLRHGRPEEVA